MTMTGVPHLRPPSGVRDYPSLGPGLEVGPSLGVSTPSTWGRRVRGGLQGEEQGRLSGLLNTPGKDRESRLEWKDTGGGVRDLGALLEN